MCRSVEGNTELRHGFGKSILVSLMYKEFWGAPPHVFLIIIPVGRGRLAPPPKPYGFSFEVAVAIHFTRGRFGNLGKGIGNGNFPVPSKGLYCDFIIFSTDLCLT